MPSSILIAAGSSRRGAEREQNEDGVFVDPRGDCLAVFDGTSGAKGSGARVVETLIERGVR